MIFFQLKKIVFFIIILIAFSCKEEKEKTTLIPILNSENNKTENITYAEGFFIEKHENYKILHIKNPWPEAKKHFKYVLISKKNAIKTTFNNSDYNGIIITPIKKIVVTSTTHIPALELLNEEHTLVGFPGTRYISSKKTRARINNKQVREIGKNEAINTEILLDINPDVLVAFGIDGKSKSLETIKKANIPVIYNGDWIEKSPLAKAEWIKFFGALYNKEKEANTIFNTIKSNYNEAKKIAQQANNKPTILCGAMHKDVWYLPSGTSTEAQFLKDANTNYLWQNTTKKGSLALPFETVFSKAKITDLWLSPSYYTSLKALKEANNHYTKFDAYINKKIYSFSKTTGETGGVLYYELGVARPDLVLKDIIKICHPELLKNYSPYFFKKLE